MRQAVPPKAGVAEMSSLPWRLEIMDIERLHRHLSEGKPKLFRDTAKFTLKTFKAGQNNIAAYTIAVLSRELGDRIDLERIWNAQGVSAELTDQIRIWAHEVNSVFERTANGRLVSEWAKKPECLEAVMNSTFSRPATQLPEIP